jgi:HD domain
MIDKCPGQDKRNITAEILKCGQCGYEKEIFSDEIKSICPKCRNISYREVLPTCVDWCKHAQECVGSEAYSIYARNKSILLKDKLIQEVETYFGSDIKRINHAKKVLDYAEELLRKEGGDWHIVVPAAILHDVGIKIAEDKYGSAAGHLQEKEGPDAAKKILLKLGFKKEGIEEICRIVGHHHSPGKVQSRNFDIILDADWLVNLKDEIGDKDKLEKMINKVFVTNTAKELAKTIYL